MIYAQFTPNGPGTDVNLLVDEVDWWAPNPAAVNFVVFDCNYQCIVCVLITLFKLLPLVLKILAIRGFNRESKLRLFVINL